MGSPEVITRVKELTTPPQGQSDVSYGLVVHANKGSYEPKWNTGINEFKRRYTPNGVFEPSCAAAMYTVKKYCEAGNVQILTVRPNTGALMSGSKILEGTPTVEFKNISLTGTSIKVGDVLTYNKNSYICKVSTTVPDTINATWLSTNFISVTPSGEVKDSIIDFNNLAGFKTGTTLKFTGDPTTASLTGVATYPAYFAVLSTNTLTNNSKIFGWWKNEEADEWNFGYALWNTNDNVFVLDTNVSIESDGTYTLPADIVCGTSTFFTASENTIEVSYDYSANMQLQTNVESYTDIQNTGMFEEIPSAGTTIDVGTGIWYAGAPYICKVATTAPEKVVASWLNYYFSIVGATTTANFQPWETGVNTIEEYEQSDNEIFTLYASNGGEWGDGITYTVENYVDDPYGIEVENCFRITFYNRGLKDTSFIVTRLEGILDANGNSMYIEDVINKRSEDYRVKDNLAIPSDVLPNTTLNPVKFGGGANGANPTDADMIKALNLIQDEAVYPLFAVGDGGYTTKNYAKAIQTLVNQRKGTKGIVCIPQVATETTTLSQAYSNIQSYLLELNMSDEKMRVETYWGYEFDADTGKDVAIPPDGCYIRNEALTKRNEGLYYPNAGWTNGVINVDLTNKWDKGYRDLLDKLKVNYAKYDEKRGTAIFSECTTLGRPSYLQQDHIMKVLLDIIPKHEALLENYLLRLAEPGIFNMIVNDMDASMQTVLDNHGCLWFEDTCGETNNSQANLDAQEVNVWCEFQPINAIKTITLTYGLTNQSARLIDIQG